MTDSPVHARHRSREVPHPLLRAAVIVAAAGVGFAIAWSHTVATQFNGAITPEDVDPLVTSVPDSPIVEDDVDEVPLNILLIGSDDRSGDNSQIAKDEAPGMRSDATVIAHLSGDRSRIDMVSIPRDLQVTISDCLLFDGTEVPGGVGDFNVAFANGGRQGNPAEGAACVINTIHDVLDIRIDHWAVVDFAGYRDMVDALGGVQLCVPQRIVSTKAGIDLQPGDQTLNGAQALGYARLRTAEIGDVSGSDLQRIARQQQLLEATMDAALSKNLFTDVAALTGFLRAGAESLTIDEDLGDINAIIGLTYSIRNVRSDDMTFTTIPWAYTSDRLNVEMTDDAQILLDDLRHDRPLSVLAEGDSTSEWEAGPASRPSPEPSATVAETTPEETSPKPVTDTMDDSVNPCG